MEIFFNFFLDFSLLVYKNTIFFVYWPYNLQNHWTHLLTLTACVYMYVYML